MTNLKTGRLRKARRVRNIKKPNMKKLYTILVLLVAFSQAQATIHIVTVSDNQFTPAILNAECGDTVKWVWESGNHTAWSTSIPTGSTGWFESINSVDTSFSHQVNLAGTYDYYCYFHPMMTGSIIVTCPTEIASLSDNDFSSLVYPNPFVNSLIIETPDATLISIYSLTGEKIKTIILTQGQTKIEINTRDMIPGMYLCSILKEGVLVGRRKLLKH